ncbi:hemerythrin HHE cation binding domain protein [Mycobacterium xenopi 4042]|uniref:Hemerythrin HHE cation binding domain protein n=1 Tax=Mycobacterium xenopi 4042 TaxID=1299334 RepID=X8CGT6_MYCXE|nr:hemerythrin HHE cation binding domain protein [Mycobacterium xenopi 4042]
MTQFLVGQHERIKSLFAETLKASGKQREKTFIELRRLLAVHETAEEEIVHPRAKRKIPNGDKVVGARLQEENEAKKVLNHLESLDVDSDEFSSQLTELRDAVVQHAEHEEQEEFAKLEEQLDHDELQRMGRAVELAEAIAPTRPHAGSNPRSPTCWPAIRGDDGPSPRRYRRQGLSGPAMQAGQDRLFDF